MTTRNSTVVDIWFGAGADLECEWGVIDNPDGAPSLKPRHLMLTTTRFVEQLLKDGPEVDRYGQMVGVRVVDGTQFFVAETEAGTHVWQLFPAQWRDRLPSDLLVGRWMD